MITKIVCYIAQSIDGYIARHDHSIDWLENIQIPEGSDMGYGAFYSSIDTVIMGRKTYNEVVGFDVPWPYSDAQCYVITKDQQLKIKTPNTQLTHQIDQKWIDEIKQKSNKNIWLIGGGTLVAEFLRLQVLDELIITTIPVVLGNGISLFPPSFPETQFHLNEVVNHQNHVVTLHYHRK